MGVENENRTFFSATVHQKPQCSLHCWKYSIPLSADAFVSDSPFLFFIIAIISILYLLQVLSLQTISLFVSYIWLSIAGQK